MSTPAPVLSYDTPPVPVRRRPWPQRLFEFALGFIGMHCTAAGFVLASFLLVDLLFRILPTSDFANLRRAETASVFVLAAAPTLLLGIGMFRRYRLLGYLLGASLAAGWCVFIAILAALAF